MKYAKKPEELIGKHILDIVAPEDRGIAEYKINERRTGARATSDMEMRLLLSPPEKEAAGEERYFSVSAEGIYTRDTPDKHSFMGTQGYCARHQPSETVGVSIGAVQKNGGHRQLWRPASPTI